MIEVVIVMILLWGINGLLSVFKAGKVCDYLMYEKKDLNFKVADIYYYHYPYLLKNWFGFRHWFYPYKK